MDKQEFVSKLRKHLQGEVVTSISKKVLYTINCIDEDFVRGTRGSSGNRFKVHINELLDAYNNGERPLTTTKLKNFISGRVQSPALAILLELEECLKDESV